MFSEDTRPAFTWTNRRTINRWPNWHSGGQVLDCFSFLGGFGLHAARAGAAHVHMLDQSAEAIAAATRNAQAQWT